MAHPMRINVLRSVVEAAGVAMAPATDQFEGEPDSLIVDIGSQAPVTMMDGGNYSRSWARPLFRDGFPQVPARPSIRVWLTGRRSRMVSA